MARSVLLVVVLFCIFAFICSCSSLQKTDIKYSDSEPLLSGSVPPVGEDTIEYGMVALRFLLNKEANILPSDFSSDNYIGFLSKPVKVRDSYERIDHVCRLYNVGDENDYLDISLQSRVLTSANGLVIINISKIIGLSVLDLAGNLYPATMGDIYSNYNPERKYFFDTDYEYPYEIQQLFSENVKNGELNLYSSALEYVEKNYNPTRLQIVYVHEGSYSVECIDSLGNSINVSPVGGKDILPAMGYGFKIVDPTDTKYKTSYLVDSNGELFQILPYEFYEFKKSSADMDLIAKENGFWSYDAKYINYDSKLDLTTVVSGDYFNIVQNEIAINGVYPIITYKAGLKPVLYLGIGFDCYGYTDDQLREMFKDLPMFYEYTFYNNFESKEDIDSITKIYFETGEVIDSNSVAFEFSSDEDWHKQYIKFYDISDIAHSLLNNLSDHNRIIEEYPNGEKSVDIGNGYRLKQFLQTYIDVYNDYLKQKEYDLYKASGRYNLGSAKVNKISTYDIQLNSFLSSNFTASKSYSRTPTTTQTYRSYYDRYSYSVASSIGDSVLSTYDNSVNNSYSSISKIGNTFYSNSSAGVSGIVTNIGNSYFVSYSNGVTGSASKIGNTLFSSYSNGVAGSATKIGNTVFSSYTDGVTGTSTSIGNTIYSYYSDGTCSTTYKIGNTYFTSYY